MNKEYTQVENSDEKVSLDGEPVVTIINDEKPLGLFGGSSLLFCSMIGTGVFISVNDTFNVFSSSNILVVVLIWLFGGFISLVGSLCYAELGCRFPKTGGECVYYEKIIGRKFSALFVIVYIFLVKSIALAALSLTAAKYLVNSFDFQDQTYLEQSTKVVALTVLYLSLLVNAVHRKFLIKFLNMFSFIKLKALLLIICLGIYSMIKGKNTDFKQPLKFEGFSLEKLAAALVSICWCYEGWNALGMKAGDVRNPSRNLISSSFIAVFLVSSIYIMCVLSYCSVLGYDSVRHSETIALSFARVKMKRAFPIMSILIFLSSIGSCIGNLYTIGGAITYAGYKEIIPGFFSMVHKKSRVPFISLLIIILISSAFVFVKFSILLNYCSFVSWFFYFLSFTCLWIAKLKYRVEYQKSFSINYFFIIIVQFVCIFVVFVCFYSHFYGCLMIAALMLGVFLMQFIPYKVLVNKYFVKSNNKMKEIMNYYFNMVPASEKDVE